MRLIDVDKITDKEIAEYLGRVFASCTEDVRCLLDEQPTAFDVDKVVEQLKKMADSLRYEHVSEYFTGEADAFEIAIEIVKGGGGE